MTDPLTPDQARLPGRVEAAGIAAWSEARRGDGEFPIRSAPRTAAGGAVVELREITGETVREICALQVAPAQRRFVAPNAVSLAEAHFSPEHGRGPSMRTTFPWASRCCRSTPRRPSITSGAS